MVICRSKFNSFTSVSLYSGRFTSVYLSCNCCPSHHTHLHSHVHTHIRTRTFSYHLGVACIYLRLFHRTLTDASDLPGMCWVKVGASNFHGIVWPRYGSTMFCKLWSCLSDDHQELPFLANFVAIFSIHSIINSRQNDEFGGKK